MTSHLDTTCGATPIEAGQEAGNLIASDKVQGSAVYNTAGESLGSIHDLMID